jgi:MSHA biogenesis protein MshM
MYYSHFGLTQPPFRITPNTEFFYSGGNRGPILEALIYAISQGEGIVKVTGEVGSGKTMLCSMLQSRLPANVETVYIANPSVSSEEILHAIALELHLKPSRDAGHLEVMQMIHNHLLERHAQDKQVVMFVEESQSMPIATLEEIRLLSNLETAHSKLLQIVLFGQPELEDNLRQPQIRQLRDRITHSFRLSPLKHDEIRDYLNFRMRAAGYRGPDLFSRSLIKTIAKASDGLTRRINLLADKALLAAFSENTHTIGLKHIKAAVRDSEFSNYEPPQPRLKLGLALSFLAIGAGLGIVFFAFFQAYQGGSAPAPEPAARASASQRNQPEPVPASPPAPATTTSATNPEKAVTPPSAAPNSPPEAARAPVAVTVTAPAAAKENQVSAPVQSISKPNSLVVGADLQKPGYNADSLQVRLAATESWLVHQDKNTYSIQLLGADNPQQLKHHLNVISKYVEINEIFVYRTVAKQKPSLTVLYGTFNDRQAARDALAQLPAPLKAYKPLLRSVQGIRAEIAQH